ncbi:GTA head formation protein, RCAP_rcc01685 family [Poseidonocella sedimentorum]|uniref:Uncharacterized protein n=1 Tax=Poseidonocella sedimentorum TaxID=871652 RepID=A0A1I6DH60_9RHOB|nr:hypothetical protein [Poseidonocella sedimentorum]SFR04779.1 hypothetical protein SAMN04515673_103241 [Poseidonocella sedimentorum]
MPDGVESFECAPGLRLEAHERLVALQFQNSVERLERLEAMIERIEKRLWLAVYGALAAILGQAFQSLLTAVP